MHKGKIFGFHPFFLFFQLLLQLWEFSILQFCRLIQIIFSLCFLNFLIDLLDLLTDLLNMLNRFLFILPLDFLTCILLFQFCQLFLQMLQPFFTQTVFFFFQCRLFNFHLHYTPTQFIQFCRHGIKFCLDQCTRFIHKIDCLIRQETV